MCKQEHNIQNLNYIINSEVEFCSIKLNLNKGLFNTVSSVDTLATLEVEGIDIYGLDIQELQKEFKRLKINESSLELRKKLDLSEQPCSLVAGGSEPKINIVFVDSTKKYKSLVESMVLPESKEGSRILDEIKFFNMRPYRGNIKYFNFYYTEAPFSQHNDDTIKIIGQFNCANNKNFEILNKTFYVIMTSKDEQSYAAHGGDAFIHTGYHYFFDEIPKVIQHELGHALCMLGDEYISEEDNEIVYSMINCFDKLDKCKSAAIELNDYKSISCYEGCYTGNHYVQWENSIMKHIYILPYEFNPIGKKTCLERIKKLVNS